MSLRWTEEELEEYMRRLDCDTSSGASRHLPHSAEQSETEAPAHRLCVAKTRHRCGADRGGSYKGKDCRGGDAPPAEIPTEDEEQIALFDWARVNEVKHPELSRLFHVPNGGSRGPAEAGRFKAMGVKRGVPDVFLDVPRSGFRGLRIEMKRRRGGVLSEEQADWIDYYNANGYRAAVCYGWDEARIEIEEYLRGGGEE